jgi:hypothetical protein
VGATCTIGYTFTPKLPGLRRGCIVLNGFPAPPLASANLFGTGTTTL